MMQQNQKKLSLTQLVEIGGFLMSALKYIQDNNPDDTSKPLNQTFFGLDINKYCPIAKMKLLLEETKNEYSLHKFIRR